MRRHLYFTAYLVLFYLGSTAQVKVKFELQSLPKAKETGGVYFIAGSFNDWKPNDERFKFELAASGNYRLALSLPTATYAYKVTRGSWDKVESGIKGMTIANREITLKNDTLVQLQVANWADNFSKPAPRHTVSANVKILDSAFLVPQLNVKRKVWIYLPPSYASTKKRYPVIYLQDGQNLFDEFTGGAEWGVDETMDSLIAKGGKESIIVGIDHGGSERLKEYNPYDSQYGKGKGKAYVEFLVNTLKPYVDAHYRTKTTYPYTSIAGSSMGGLIAMYAIATYPKVFGTAGVFSPAFWVGKAIEQDLKLAIGNLKQHRIYLIAGTLEGKMMIRDMQSAYQILDSDGKNKHIKMVEKPDGKHSEWFWRREFPDFYKFIAK